MRRVYGLASHFLLFVFTSGLCEAGWEQPFQWIDPSAWVNCVGVNGSLIVVDTSVYYSTESWWGVTFVSTNNGVAWSEVGILQSTHIAFDRPNVFLGSSEPWLFGIPTVRLYRSTNDGLTWGNITPWPTATTNMSFIRKIDSALFASVSAGFFRSIDNGDHWVVLTNRLPAPATQLAHSGGRLVAACSSGDTTFFPFSTDRGETWNPSGGCPGGTIDLAVLPQAVGNDLLFAGTWNKGLFRSSDVGFTWTPIGNGVADTQITHLAVSGTTLFAATRAGQRSRLCASSDAGDHWRTVDQGLPSVPYLGLALDSTFMYVGTYRGGLWRRPLLEMTTEVVRREAPDHPSKFALGQNYPNPFNPTTLIRYLVPRSRTVTIEVCDVLGRKVAALVDGMHQPGSYSVAWDATKHSSGVYFCRMVSDNFVAVRKMMVLK